MRARGACVCAEVVSALMEVCAPLSHLPRFETSAKDNRGISEACDFLVSTIIRREQHIAQQTAAAKGKPAVSTQQQVRTILTTTAAPPEIYTNTIRHVHTSIIPAVCVPVPAC